MSAPITYIANWIDEENADSIFKWLMRDLAWVQRDALPRREYYVNDFGEPYTYGTAPYEKSYEPQPKHRDIERIQWMLEGQQHGHYEAVFLNRYDDASDSLGWHSDDSPAIDASRPIAIVSLGAEREIWFRRNTDDEFPFGAEVEKLRLGHGSLCIMHAGMQQTHQHRIPKSDRVCGPRISLTFRGFLPQGLPSKVHS